MFVFNAFADFSLISSSVSSALQISLEFYWNMRRAVIFVHFTVLPLNIKENDNLFSIHSVSKHKKKTTTTWVCIYFYCAVVRWGAFHFDFSFLLFQFFLAPFDLKYLTVTDRIYLRVDKKTILLWF